MSRRMTATEARVHFGEVIRSVTEGEEAIIVERGGRPAAVVISVSHYEELREKRDGEISSRNQGALDWLEAWMKSSDEKGDGWWKGFEQELREHPVRFGGAPE